MDDYDNQIIDLLQKQGRVSHSELSAKVGLSLPAIAERIRKLEKSGVILGYTSLVDAKKLGKGITAFISVLIDDPASYPQFSGSVLKLPEVTECHHVVGEFDYLVKVKTKDTASLEALISDRIRTIPGVGRTRTTIVLSTLKESTVIEIEKPKAKERKKRNG